MPVRGISQGVGAGSVSSVTGLNTDNADPFNPVVKISVDGVTVTGLGTPGSPLMATGLGTAAWGAITGTLSNQTDLQNALNLKANLISPSFTTPTLGVATATSVNKLTLTTPATGSTLTIVDGATLTASATATVSGTNTGDQTTVSGNAGTATALQTARTINGVSFDGTANIVVAAAAGTLTGSTLAAGVTASSLTSVGTIATGIWNGTTIDVAHGGTNLTTLTANNVILGNGTGNPLFVAPGTSGNVLTSNGTIWTSVAGPVTGAMTLLSTQTASNSAVVDFTSGIDSTYTKYIVEFFGLVAATDGSTLRVRLQQSSSFVSSASYDFAFLEMSEAGGTPSGADASTRFDLAGGVDSALPTSGQFELYNPSAVNQANALWKYVGPNQINNTVVGYGGGILKTNAATTGIRFLMDTGNITSGTFKLYGVL